MSRIPSRALPIVAFIAAFVLQCSALHATPKPLASDGRAYGIGALSVSYENAELGVPGVDELLAIEVQLGETDEGYVAPREDVPQVAMRIGDIGARQSKPFYATAIRAINQAIVNEFSKRGFVDIYVSPEKGQFGSDGADLRGGELPDLKLSVRLGQVAEIRTSALGDRFEEDADENNPAHVRILENSPIASGTEAGKSSVLRKDQLNEYLYYLNRHPGRQVDATIGLSKGGKGVSLDYVIKEDKPWLSYLQISNTGTDVTNEWRERIGYVDNQLTNRDDILSIDYITGGFENSHALLGNYEAPLLDFYRTRWQTRANYSEFTSSDVGIVGSDFSGDDWSVGGDIFYNYYQRREMFLDAFVGVSYRNITTENVGIGGEGEDSFFIPQVGTKLERFTPTKSSVAAVWFETNLAGVAGSSVEDSEDLGRSDPDVDWELIGWNASHRFYLEPLFTGTLWEEGVVTNHSTLAHEMALSFKGQHAFGNRLIPHEEITVGGLYTVRGYDESLLASDGALIASFEYLFHFPRLLPPKPEKTTKIFGKTFRPYRESTYGRPDWDLALKAFVDMGRTIIPDASFGEEEHDLLSTGLGLEFLVWRNFSVRSDWGFALRQIDDLVDVGDSEFHFVCTLLF